MNIFNFSMQEVSEFGNYNSRILLSFLADAFNILKDRRVRDFFPVFFMRIYVIHPDKNAIRHIEPFCKFYVLKI